MDFVKTKGMKRENLVVFDSLNLAFRWKHSGRKDFLSEMITTIQSISNSYQAKKVIILGDWGSSWRKEIYPLYKANRKEMIANQTEEDAKKFEEFLSEYNKTFEVLGTMYTCFKFKGCEADDIAAYLALNESSKYEHTWLISTDKDWDLLIKDNISRFAYTTRKEITWDNWDTHYPYSPAEHISVKVLQGDSGDNVPGVSGVGPKRAVTLIDKYGSAYEIYDQLPIPDKYIYEKNLNLFADQILLNYKLMDLETYYGEAIGIDNCKQIEEKLND